MQGGPHQRLTHGRESGQREPALAHEPGEAAQHWQVLVAYQGATQAGVGLDGIGQVPLIPGDRLILPAHH